MRRRFFRSHPLLTSYSTLLLLLLPVSGPVHEDSRDPNMTFRMMKEEFVYEVSWTFFKLGTIRIQTLGQHEARAYIDSYEGLPFVDLHSIYYTQMDSLFFSRGAHSFDKNEKEWTGLTYRCEDGGMVVVERAFLTDPSGEPYRREFVDTVQAPGGRFVDGLSIGYVPRPLIHTIQTVTVPTILKGELGNTTFYFTGKRTLESISVLDEPVRVIEVRGTTNVEGIFGMTGDFTGWFSDDAAAVPIKGKLKVLLGSVTVELIQWKRDGWSPPH